MFIQGEAIWVDVNTDYLEDADHELVADLDAIRNSLFNLFSCPIGSRPFQRDYGCQLIAYLMEPADNTTAEDLKFSLLASISRWEPRIKVVTNACSVIPNEDGLDISLEYVVIKSLQRARYQYNARRANV